MNALSWNIAYSDPVHEISDTVADCLPLRSNGFGLTRRQREIIWAIFRSHHALRMWPEDVLNELISVGRLRSYADGTLVYPENSPNPDVDVVLSGVLEWGWTNSNGMRILEDLIPPGEVTNLTSVFIDQRSIHDQRAHGLTRIFHIPFEAFQKQLDGHPKLMSSLLYILAVRKRELHQRLRKAGLTSFRARLANRLLFLANRFGRLDQDGVVVHIRISQDDLAALVMASRQHTNKELRWFIDLEIISIRYGRISIHDIEQLRAVSEENTLHAVR